MWLPTAGGWLRVSSCPWDRFCPFLLALHWKTPNIVCSSTLLRILLRIQECGCEAITANVVDSPPLMSLIAVFVTPLLSVCAASLAQPRGGSCHERPRECRISRRSAIFHAVRTQEGPSAAQGRNRIDIRMHYAQNEP
jgi:hypothetical protein